MRKFMKEHNVWLKVLSVVLAIILWAVVMGVTNPERTRTFDGIKVAIIGEEQLLEQRGLSVIEYDISEISVRLKGPNSDLSASGFEKKITASIDVSKQQAPGEYDLKPDVYTNRSSIDFVSSNPGTIHVRIDRIATKSVPIKIDVTGTPKEGSRFGTPTSTTETVMVEGPEAELSEVSYAHAVIDGSGIDATVTQECAISLYNEEGEMIDSPYITSATEKIRVRLPVHEVNNIPLAVTFKDGANEQVNQAKWTIEPESVNVYGNQTIISELKEINIGEINLGNVKTDVPIEMDIVLPEGINLADGEPKTAKVTVTIDGVATRKVEVQNFIKTDTEAGEAANIVSFETQSVEIELRGTESALEAVDESIFSVGITIDSASLGEGTHAVKGVIVATGLPNGVTLVEEDVQVSIIVKPKGSG